MKAVRKPDGTVEFDGSVEEISKAFGLVPSTPPPSKRVPPPPRQVGTRVPGSLPAKIVALFTAEPERIFSPNEVADLVKGDKKAVRGTLSRMARDEDPPVIESVGRGKYKLIQKGGAL